MRRKLIIQIISLSIALAGCEKKPSDVDNQGFIGHTYILNNGNMGGNDSNIGLYDPASKTFTPDVFLSVNGQKLGDLGQDIVSIGNSVYIAVNGSKTIFKTDINLKIKSQIAIRHEDIRLSPKHLAIAGNKVYVTCYEGWVAEIAQDDSYRLCKVGNSPEGIASHGDELYVANSGGALYPNFEKSISIVNLNDFKVRCNITVNDNPAMVVASENGEYIYVLSRGNYTDCPEKLQVISGNEVIDLDYTSVSSIAKGPGDILYILCGGYDADWNPLPGTVFKHDMKHNIKAGAFVTDGTILNKAYSISATSDGYVYVGCSDYTNTGDVYVFTSGGKMHDKFDSQGLNPLKAYS